MGKYFSCIGSDEIVVCYTIEVGNALILVYMCLRIVYVLFRWSP
jgi:hypothetical protein